MSGAEKGAAPLVSGAPEWFESLAAAAAETGAVLVAIDAFDSPLTRLAAIVLPALTYGEIEGTFTSFAGRVQRVRAGLAPGADALPVYRLAQEIARRLGAELAARHGAQETFSALCADIPAFAGLSYARVGEKGATLAGSEAGARAGAGPEAAAR
jgi:predicted molibdopterin-dependent oxidoreductase YjgC